MKQKFVLLMNIASSNSNNVKFLNGHINLYVVIN